MDHFETEPKEAVRDEDRWKRTPSGFRRWIRDDHSSPFPPAAHRYHLYVSYACPWAHRTLITRALLGLEDVFPLSVVHPVMDDRGWKFAPGPGCIPDTLHDASFLRQVYERAAPDYDGKWTVPVLWDTETSTIVNNESREIMRMMTGEFGRFRERNVDLCPESLRQEIDETIDWLYDGINDGVYRVGFARSQGAYDEAVESLFHALEQADQRLEGSRFLCGPTLTEADICLFTTLFRFEPVYAIHFKCSTRPLSSFPNLHGFLRDVHQIPGVSDTCDLHHIKQHYYRSHGELNPRRIVPHGPLSGLHRPAGRAHLGRSDGDPLRRTKRDSKTRDDSLPVSA